MELDGSFQPGHERSSIDVVSDDVVSRIALRNDVVDRTRCFHSRLASHRRRIAGCGASRESQSRTWPNQRSGSGPWGLTPAA